MSTKYNKIGINYNQTRKADSYLTEQLLKHLNPIKGGLYLDIGCGTGNYTNELAKRGINFIGIDPSTEMLEKARHKNPNIRWEIGTAEKTSLPKDSLDGIIATLTIHHWTNLRAAFSELSRILKPKGKLVIFTSTPKQMKGYWLNHYFPKMLQASIIQMPTYEAVEDAMKLAGFEVTATETYNIRPDLQDQFLYCGKQNPELYFGEDIRHGISSFSSLAHKDEVEKGLASMRKDIDSGKIIEVMSSYVNDDGDYLYVVGIKINHQSS